MITEAEAPDFIDHLLVERFWGVGRKTTIRLHRMGIFTGKEFEKPIVKTVKRYLW